MKKERYRITTQSSFSNVGRVVLHKNVTMKNEVVLCR